MSTVRTRHPARRDVPGRPQMGALTRAQRRELEAELQRERTRLERSLAASPADASAGDAEDHDHAPTTAEDGLAVAVELRAPGRHAAIVDALARMERGVYGRCAICGERIPYGRLLAIPETTHCIVCGARG